MYWCALSLRRPPALHPQSARLAARFLRGSDAEKYLVVRTVLRWRGVEVEPPCTDSPLFASVRALPHLLSALDWGVRPDPAHVVSLMLLHLPHRWIIPYAAGDPAALLLSEAPWRERNEVALNWVLPLALGPPPPTSKEAEPQRFAFPPDPLCNNNDATHLLLAFQAMEGSFLDCAHAFNFMQESFVVTEGVADAWFVVT